MFGPRLKELRKAKGITQEELASIVGVERSSIGKYEGKSHVVPSDDVKVKLAEYFKVSIGYLLGRNNEETSSTDDDSFSVDKQKLIEDYRSLSEERQEWIRRCEHEKELSRRR